MGIWDTLTELVEAATPWAVAEAEAPAKEEDSKDESAEDKADSEEAESEDKDEGGEDGGDGEGGESDEAEDGEGEEEEEEEEEDDEEEIVDPKETLEEECRNSQKCSSAKHHYEECAERVANGSKEDCVEEFFHLTHCATQCAAGKLWSKLK